MKKTITVQNTASFPALTILGLIFITLKLTDYIDWAWWWVLAPFWVVPAFVFGVLAIIGALAAVVAIMERKR